MRILRSAVAATLLFSLPGFFTIRAATVLGGQNIQSPRLRGTIKDPSGAVMSAVDIAIIQGTTVVKAVKTDSVGTFSFDLPAGQYQLAVTAPDFKTYTQAVRVTLNMSPLAITLSLEGISSTVEVTADNKQVMVDAASSLDATILTPDDLKDLPEDEESLLAYLQNLAGGTGNAQLIIDGFEGGRLPTRDQIAQIIIEPNSFNANGTGPRITVVSRTPGDTRWSGGLSLQFQDAALNTRNPNAANKPPLRRTVVSTNYRGPIIKGKLGMTFSATKEQYESGGNSIRAITLDGPVNSSIVSPSTYDSFSLSNNWYISTTNSLTYSFSYNRQKSENQGVGNFNLPERASNNKSHGWNFQFSDNLTLSPRMTNRFQFRTNRNESLTNPITDAVAINVLDAFNGGGAQNHSETRNASYNLTNSLQWAPTEKWNFQITFNANYQTNRNFSENNYLGTFTFSSLEDYRAGRPLTFTQTSGNPLTQTKQFDANVSVQGAYRFKPTVSLNLGAQYGAQTHFNDHNNISPTAQLQFQKFKTNRSVFSIGARLTFPTVGFNMNSYEQLLRGDGTTRQFQTVISNPSYPNPFEEGDEGTTNGVGGSSILVRSPHLVSQYTMNTQVGLNQTLPRNWRFTVTFAANRGVHLLRTRNINAPFPGTPLPSTLTREEVDRLRPYFPLTGRINMYESTGNNLSKTLNLNVSIPVKKILKSQVQGSLTYTATWSHDDGSPVNLYDVRSEWAQGADSRHRVTGTLSVRPPKAGSFSFNFTANTGRAYTITTGKDDNLDQNINDRPAGVPRNSMRGPGQYNVNLNYSSLAFNLGRKKPAAAAATPAAGAAGATAATAVSAQDQLIQSALAAGIPLASIPQLIAAIGNNPNALAGATTPQEPPSLLHPRFTFGVQVNNLLNNTKINGYGGVIGSPFFGKPTGFSGGRTLRLSLSSSF